MKSQQICVRVSDKLYDKLREVADAEDRSVSYIVNRELERIFLKESREEDV